jgi:8-oxo-dGTP diphosphatase
MINIVESIKQLIKEADNINYKPGDLNPNHETIAIYIKNNKNEILIQYHNKFNFWIIPVGKIDSGETPEQALKKEAFEELDISITKFKLMGTFENDYIRNNINVHIKSYMFEVLEYIGTIKNKEPHKHRELKFASKNELKQINPMPDAIKNLLSLI